MTTKARRLSIYVSPKDTEVLRWMDEQTSDGTSESEAILRLVRKEIRGEPSPVEAELRATIMRLEGLLERTLRGAAGATLPKTSKSIAPDHRMADIDTEKWEDWDARS